jgi:hypothetical protein
MIQVPGKILVQWPYLEVVMQLAWEGPPDLRLFYVLPPSFLTLVSTLEWQALEAHRLHLELAALEKDPGMSALT